MRYLRRAMREYRQFLNEDDALGGLFIVALTLVSLPLLVPAAMVIVAVEAIGDIARARIDPE